jgi:hypothetical protein
VVTDIRAGWRFTRLRVDFDSLKTLLGTELYRDRNFSLMRTAEGNYLLMLARGGRAEPRRDTPHGSAEHGESAGILAGFHVTITITVPDTILDTNAHRRTDFTVTWEYDIDKDTNALLRMGEEQPYIVFAGGGLELPEIRPGQPGKPAPD